MSSTAELKAPAAKLDEASPELVSLSAQLGELIDYRKSELKRLQQETLTEQAIKAGVKRDCEQLKADSQTELRQLKADAKAEIDADRKALQSEQRSLEYQRMEVEGRIREAKDLEAQSEVIRQQQAELASERLAIEQQRIRNEALTRENDRLADTHATAYAELARRESEVVKVETGVRATAAEQDQRAKALTDQETSVHVQVENLTSLKKTIDPKLKEVSKLSEQSSSDRAQQQLLYDATQKAQAEIDQQKSDLATLASQLQAKSEALLAFDAQLKRTEATLNIKIQQAKLKGITLDAPEEKPEKR